MVEVFILQGFNVQRNQCWVEATYACDDDAQASCEELMSQGDRPDEVTYIVTPSNIIPKKLTPKMSAEILLQLMKDGAHQHITQEVFAEKFKQVLESETQ